MVKLFDIKSKITYNFDTFKSIIGNSVKFQTLIGDMNLRVLKVYPIGNDILELVSFYEPVGVQKINCKIIGTDIGYLNHPLEYGIL